MTNEELTAAVAALREAESKMTPGEWKVQRRWSNQCEIIPSITCPPDANRECGWIADLIGAPYLGHESTLPNAAGIVALRNTAMPVIDALIARERGLREALEWVARIHCKENPPCSSRMDYACDSCMARAALAEPKP